MRTREEALALIDQAGKAMAEAHRLAEEAKRASAEAGLLTAADIITEGVQSASDQVFALLPTFSDYVGLQSSSADKDAIVQAGEEVKSVAVATGHLFALLVKVAVRAMGAA